jgi:PAS domain S-box-containing protein
LDWGEPGEPLKGYRYLVEKAADGVCVLDSNGRFIYFNPKFTKIFEYSPRDLYGRDFSMIVHPDDLPRVKRIHGYIAQGNSPPRRYEYRGLTRKGDVRYIEASAAPIEDDGRVVGIQMIVRDASRRQKSEERIVLLYHLSRSLNSTLSLREVLYKVVRVLSVMLRCQNCFILLLDGETLRCAAATDSVWDKARDLTIDLHGVSLAAETVRIRTPIAVREAHRSPIVNQRLREYFGHKSLLSVPLMVKDRALGAIVLGETERLRRFTEEEVELASTIAGTAAVAIENARLYEEIWRTKNFLESIIDSSADAIITTDLEGRITSFSRGAEELFGYPAADVIGEQATKLYPEMRKDQEMWMQRLREGDALRNIKSTVCNSRGGQMHVSLSISLLRDSEGRAIGTVMVARDITQEVMARKRLTEAYRELRELDRLKDELIANVSHELRTPITIAKTTMELALREKDPQQRTTLLNLGIGAMNRQNNIVADLITLHEMRSRRFRLRREPVDMVYLAQCVAEEMQPMALAKDVRLTVRAGEDLPRVKADFKEMKHVLRNLVDNAIKFNQAGGEVWIELRGGRGYVEVRVKDTGIGIPPEHLEKIFDPFYQIDGRLERRYGGTGMGLAIVKEIVEAHGGRVKVKSTKRKGSTFVFTLPL